MVVALIQLADFGIWTAAGSAGDSCRRWGLRRALAVGREHAPGAAALAAQHRSIGTSFKLRQPAFSAIIRARAGGDPCTGHLSICTSNVGRVRAAGGVLGPPMSNEYSIGTAGDRESDSDQRIRLQSKRVEAQRQSWAERSSPGPTAAAAGAAIHTTPSAVAAG